MLNFPQLSIIIFIFMEWGYGFKKLFQEFEKYENIECIFCMIIYSALS